MSEQKPTTRIQGDCDFEAFLQERIADLIAENELLLSALERTTDAIASVKGTTP